MTESAWNNLCDTFLGQSVWGHVTKPGVGNCEKPVALSQRGPSLWHGLFLGSVLSVVLHAWGVSAIPAPENCINSEWFPVFLDTSLEEPGHKSRTYVTLSVKNPSANFLNYILSQDVISECCAQGTHQCLLPSTNTESTHHRKCCGQLGLRVNLAITLLVCGSDNRNRIVNNQ